MTAAEELRLPGAVGSCPGWLKAGAPFDMDAFFAPPAEGKNAEPLYLEALVEFGSDFAEILKAAGRAPLVGIKDRMDRLTALSAAMHDDPAAVDRKAVDALLAELDDGFRKIAVAQRRPACVFRIGIGFDALLPHAQDARQVARAAGLRAERDAEKGEMGRPIRDLEMTLRLSRDLRPRGGTIVQLVSIAIDGHMFNGVTPILLRSKAVKAEHCDALVAAMRRHEEAGLDRFATAVKAEYVAMRETLRMAQEGRRTKAGPDGRPVDEKVTPRQAAEALAALGLQDDGKSGPAHFQERIRSHAGSWAGERKAMDELARRLLGPGSARYADRVRLHEELSRKLQGDRGPTSPWMSRLFMPDYKTLALAAARGDCYNRAAEAVVAIARWRLTHEGADPADLAAACKEAGLPGVPADPFGDGPLKMTTLDGAVVVYSIGPDGVDDRGLKDSNMGREPQGDLVFRLRAEAK